MTRWYQIRHLRGAVFLIVLGVLALLNQWNVLRWSISWPILLIVLGLLMLAERAAWTADVREQQAAQSIGAERAEQATQFNSAGPSYWSAPPPPADTGIRSFVQSDPPAPGDPSTPEDSYREDR